MRAILVAAGFLLVLGIASAIVQEYRSAQSGGAPPETEQTSGLPPGLERVGEAKALELWAEIETTPGLHSIDCMEDLCTVAFDPSMWAQMPYDLKRDAVAGLGIAATAGAGARWTEVRDMYSNERLARYSARSDNVTID